MKDESESLRNDILKELVRIEKIQDENEKQALSRELNEKIRKLNELLYLEREQKRRAISENMKERGIITCTCNLNQGALKEKWENAFAGGLTPDEKEQIYLPQFLWHIFSYERVSHLKNAPAREAFNKVRKSVVIGFYQNKKDVVRYENAALLKDTDFDMEDDIYLVDPDFQWTYAVTHEKGLCGPYYLGPQNAL